MRGPVAGVAEPAAALAEDDESGTEGPLQVGRAPLPDRSTLLIFSTPTRYAGIERAGLETLDSPPL